MPRKGDCDAGTELTIRRPDDLHVHFRDEATLKAVVHFTASQFARAIVMPNLKPPIRTLADAQAYRKRIMDALPSDCQFTPLMTLYLTDATTADDITTAHNSGLVNACKLYPAGATTNSSLGVTSLNAIAPALSAMQAIGMVLCVHGEVTSPDVDMFDREAQFVTDVLPKLLVGYPTLKIVLEHITTSNAVEAVLATPSNRLAASITPHHLLYSRQALFANSKIHPYMFCLPVLKRDSHRLALLDAIAKDDGGRFFAGTDSAPHTSDAKFCANGCAGIFSAHCALLLYAEAFEKAGMLHRLERFVSENGARFYGLPLNEGEISIVKENFFVPEQIGVEGAHPIVPLRAGENVSWRMME